MKLTWYGHAAFLIEGEADGQPVRLLTDPYRSPDCGGYAPVDAEADVVTLSHENPVFHSDLSSIRGDYQAVRALELPPEGIVARGVPVRSLRVFENESRDPEGENAMVRFEMEGLSVAHLGDLGHMLNARELEFLRGTDILLALAGGAPTIALTDLQAVIEALEIPLVLPMHYAVPGIRLNLRPVDDLAALFGPERIERRGSSSLIVTRETLPDRTTVVILDPLRLAGTVA